MPLWPLPPILALISLGYIFTKQISLLLWVTLITIGIGLVYWPAVIFPQRGGGGMLLASGIGCGLPEASRSARARLAEGEPDQLSW